MNYDLNKLFEIIIAFNREKDYLNLLNIILAKMMEITNADGGTLYIIEDGRLHFRIVRNISLNIFQSSRDKINLPPIELDPENISSVCAYAALKNEIISIDDVYQNDKFNFEGPKNYDKITGYRTCSMLAMPMTATVEDTIDVIGVIQLINAKDETTGEIIPFRNIYNPPVLPALSNIAANTLSNLLHEKETKDLLYSFVRVMTQAIDERSPYNSNHTHNVAEYCDRFAEYLNTIYPISHKYYFSANRKEQLTLAAFLHDIGKIITPLNIMDKADRLGEQLEIVRYKLEIKKYQIENEFLSKKITKEEYEVETSEFQAACELIEQTNTAGFLTDDKLKQIKQLEKLKYIDASGKATPVLTLNNIESLSIIKGTLTDGERLIMQEHVSLTDRLLANIMFKKQYKDVQAWAKGHHEFIDGTGYPDGLRDEQVTAEMCILTIIDIYDALTAKDRPYRKAIPSEKALDILSSMVSEGKLNKELVGLFTESGVWKTIK